MSKTWCLCLGSVLLGACMRPESQKSYLCSLIGVVVFIMYRIKKNKGTRLFFCPNHFSVLRPAIGASHEKASINTLNTVDSMDDNTMMLADFGQHKSGTFVLYNL